MFEKCIGASEPRSVRKANVAKIRPRDFCSEQDAALGYNVASEVIKYYECGKDCADCKLCTDWRDLI